MKQPQGFRCGYLSLIISATRRSRWSRLLRAPRAWTRSRSGGAPVRGSLPLLVAERDKLPESRRQLAGAWQLGRIARSARAVSRSCGRPLKYPSSFVYTKNDFSVAPGQVLDAEDDTPGPRAIDLNCFPPRQEPPKRPRVRLSRRSELGTRCVFRLDLRSPESGAAARRRYDS